MNRRMMMTKAMRDAMPIILAYFPISMSFGVISMSNGMPWLITILISAWVYAGGAQFILVSLALTGVSPLSAIMTVLLVNMRHFLYGTALGPAYTKWSETKKWIAAFTLTDEVFAVTSNRILQEPPSPAYQFTFGFACYGSWLAGTIVGASIGQAVPTAISQVLVFALPALFLALLVSTSRTGAHFVAALGGAILAVIAQLLHWGSVGIILGAIVGATLGMFWNRLIKRPTGQVTIGN